MTTKIISNSKITPQVYLEIMLGKCFIYDDTDSDMDFIDGILEQYNQPKCHIPLSEILEHDDLGPVILIECAFFDKNNMLHYAYHWYQVDENRLLKYTQEYNI